MSTPQRRRKDREAPNRIADAPTIVPTTTSEISNHVEGVVREPAYESIARRAYQLYEERGGAHGQDLEDWLHAEQELRRRAFHVVIDSILTMDSPSASV